MDNFESIASPSLARPPHICEAIPTLDLHWEPCGPLLSCHQSVGKPTSVRPIFRISSAWRSRNFRPYAYLAIRYTLCFYSWFVWSRCCWRMRGWRNCWGVVWPRPPEIRLSNLVIASSVLPWMEEAIQVIFFPLVARGRPQLVSASRHPELWSGVRLLALLGPPGECVCRFYSRRCPSLHEMWWLTWMPSAFFSQISVRKNRERLDQ